MYRLCKNTMAFIERTWISMDFGIYGAITMDTKAALNFSILCV